MAFLVSDAERALDLAVALTASGTTLSATEGTEFSGGVAGFTDANPAASASDFSATIIWGERSRQMPTRDSACTPL